MGWLLYFGLNEGLVECVTVCLKSEVILLYLVSVYHTWIYNFALNMNANTIDFRFFLTFLDVTYDGV